MDVTPYVERLRNELTAAAQLGGPDVQHAAAILAGALESSARLLLMEAASQTAAEITAELPAGAVDARLAGREIQFVLTVPPQGEAPADPAAADEDASARITLRLPPSVKARAEAAAEQAGLSLNNWVVGVLRRAASGDVTTLITDRVTERLGAGRRGTKLSGWI